MGTTTSRARGARLLAAVLALSACTDLSTEVQEADYGIIVASTSLADGQPRLTAIATFFRSPAFQLPNSEAHPNSCQILRVGNFGTAPRNDLAAGDSIRMTVDDQVLHLVPTLTPEGNSYQLRPAQSATVSVGDLVRFEVPGGRGGGFPAATIEGRVAEPFTLSELPATIPETQPLRLTWTPAGDNSSVMILTIQYVRTAGGTDITEQIHCTVSDDGSFDIPSEQTFGLRQSSEASRQVRGERWRTEVVPAGNAQLLLLTLFTVLQ